MTYNGIYITIHDFIELATGLAGKDIRKVRPNAPASLPADRAETVSIGLINPRPLSRDLVTYEDIEESDNVTEREYTNQEVTASINFYGENSADTAQNVLGSIRLAAIIEIFNRAGIGILRRGDITNISGYTNGNFEERRHLDITLNVRFKSQAEIDTFGQASIESDVVTPYNNHNQTTIEVTE